MPVLPFAILAALAILALAVRAFVRVLKENRGGRRIPARQAIVFMACCITLWLGLCFFFMVLASLGHSAHPLRDSWLQCVVSFFVLVVFPLTLFAWFARRSSGKDKPQDGGGVRQP